MIGSLKKKTHLTTVPWTSDDNNSSPSAYGSGEPKNGYHSKDTSWFVMLEKIHTFFWFVVLVFPV